MKQKTLSNIFYVLSKTWRYERSIILIILLQVIIGIFVPFIAIYLPSTMLDGIIGMSDTNAMFIKIMGLLFVLAICNWMNSYISSIYETYLLNNKIRFLTELFGKKMELDYAFIESTKGQNMYQYAMTTLLNDNQGVSGMLHIIASLLSNGCSILLYTRIIAGLNFQVMIVLIGTSAIHLLILRKTLQKQHSKKDSWTDIDRKINYLLDFVQKEQNNKDIKLYSMQGWLSKATDKLIKDRLLWVKKLANYSLITAISDIILLIIRDGLAYFCIFKALLTHEIEISQFVFYFGAITGFSTFMTSFTSDFAYISQKSREVDGLRDYLDINHQNTDVQLLHQWSGDSISIEFINVSFRFTKESPYILRHLNLKINKGEKVALVGENGAGKTTLVKLICGFYKATQGTVLIDGIDIRTLSQASIGKLFATVFQDTHILPMSVAENIAFAHAAKNPKDIEYCIKLSGLADVLPDIHAPVTKMLYNEGIILSGGQEQKLMLARAVYKILYNNSSALILDEPTAALDPIAEKDFYEKYNTLANKKTSIFISHRLASTRFCDRIIMLESGKIVENGTHKDLMTNGCKYKELYDIQSQYYK